jgi:hypothetical protein
MPPENCNYLTLCILQIYTFPLLVSNWNYEIYVSGCLYAMHVYRTSVPATVTVGTSS